MRHLSAFARAFAYAFVLGVLSGCGSAPAVMSARAPLPTASPVGLETPAAGSIYLGAYVNTTMASTETITLEKRIGQTFAMDVHFYTWTGTFPRGMEDGDLTYGRLPIDSWNCGPTDAQIVSGAADLLIETRALAIKSFGHPIFLRYLWDMNGPAGVFSRGACYDPSTDNADGTFSAAEYVAAWKHIRAIFTAKNVTNVIWLWCPNAAYGDPTPYYPGDAEVDWVGVDAFDTTGAGFNATFAPIYPTYAQFGKPIVVAETGERAADQAAFFSAATTELPTQFPLVKGFVYYDSDDTNGSTGIDWILTSSGINGLAALATNPYFSAKGSL